jgi:hypothetical protein
MGVRTGSCAAFQACRAILARVAQVDREARQAFDRLATFSPPMAPDTTACTSAMFRP